MFVWLKLVFGTYGPAVRTVLTAIAMLFSYIAPIVRDVQALKRASKGDWDNGLPRSMLMEFCVKYGISEERRIWLIDEPLEYPWATLAYEAALAKLPSTAGVSESTIRCVIEFVYAILKIAGAI